ncbi:MAG: hypothetical protein VB858_14685 [Planctomycetaceae bacterium]
MARKGTKRDGSKSQAIRDYFKANPGTGAKIAHAALAKQGVTVSLALVNKVKYEAGPIGKTARKKSITRRKATSSRRGRPAGGGVSLSDRIRGYMADNPDATRPEIREGLKQQGVDVKTSLVNAVFVKSHNGAGPKAKRGRPGRKPAATASSAGTLSAAELIDAKKVVDSLGGIARVREALGLLEQLQ